MNIEDPIIYLIEGRSLSRDRYFAIIRCLNGIFVLRKCSVKALYLLLFSFGFMYQYLKGEIPSRKCFIKTPANAK